MSKQRERKEQVVGEIKQKLDSSSAVILTDYRGLNVSQVTRLRAELRKADVEYKVLKNTLTSLAAHELDLAGLDTFLTGPTAIAFSKEDPVAPAKILTKFAKEFKVLEIKGGLLDGKIIDSASIKALADLPGREELLAQVLRGMLSPLSGLANVLNGPIRNLVYVLEAVRKQKAGAEA
ncbi:MAG TPA: 50S ribosomal protein L10 [Clostridia bacterium]|nr:50S ribosomal protein L10 [Clostridia bacterium]